VSQERFDIYFAGELLPDQPVATVREWLSRQFNLQGAALDQLFSGEAVRIKQDVDMETASRFRAAFRKAGALVEIRPVPSPETAQPIPASGDEPELLPPNTGTLEDYAEDVEAAPLPDIGHIDLAGQEQPLDDTPPPPPADIQTDHLSAEPANTGDLSEYAEEKPSRPIPDISRLKLEDE
jgi:hypothetical protein